MTSLDGINGWSIQTLLTGENDSKWSDEIQTKTIEDSLVFNALVFLHTQEKENSPSRAPVIVNTLSAEFFLPGTIGILKPVNIIIFQAVFPGADLGGGGGCRGCAPPRMTWGRFLINTVQSLHRHTKSALSFDMYSQQFTLCYFLVKSPLLRIRF